MLGPDERYILAWLSLIVVGITIIIGVGMIVIHFVF